METADAGVEEALPCSFKVHSATCSKLRELIDKIMEVLPELEAARPRCSAGIEPLCLLSKAIEKGKLLLQYCSESSKLYLAATGDAIVSRCKRTRNLLEQSLNQIQSMIPVILALKVASILDDLRVAMFILDPSEEEAGKAVRELLEPSASSSASVEEFETRTFQFAACKLQITTPKTILIEKRSMTRLLERTGDSELNKKKILKYLLNLLKKYGNSIIEERKNNSLSQPDESFAHRQCSNGSVCAHCIEMECNGERRLYDAGISVLWGPMPPEEFRCALSSRIMYDPVVIASGQTFERMWIQKWFDEGNKTCPRTKVTLDHLLLTPNMGMKELISQWCSKYGITVHDPSEQREASSSVDVSSSSIASFGSFMNDFSLPSDISNTSLETLDSCSETSGTKMLYESSLTPLQTAGDLSRCQSKANFNETDRWNLSKLSELSQDAQRKVVEDLTSHLNHNDQAFQDVSAENSVEPLVKFLKDSNDRNDVEAARAGLQLLLKFLRQNRNTVDYLGGDACGLVSDLLDSEVTTEALSIIEVLSASRNGRLEITSSGALQTILTMIDSGITGFEAQALKILQNMSSSSDVCAEMANLHCIPKLSPLLHNPAVAGNCLIILRNLCNIEKARASLAETDGCIPSVVEFLESGNSEEQENAAVILLSLCSQNDQYCRLVMDEGINLIPNLVHASLNGNAKARASAQELLRLLRDVNFNDEPESVATDLHSFKPANVPTNKRSPLSRSLFRLFRRGDATHLLRS